MIYTVKYTTPHMVGTKTVVYDCEDAITAILLAAKKHPGCKVLSAMPKDGQG